MSTNNVERHMVKATGKSLIRLSIVGVFCCSLLLAYGCDRMVSGEQAAPSPAPPVAAPVEARSVTLDLVDVALEKDIWTVELFYNRSADQEAPRVMELMVAVGEGLHFEGAVAGEALDLADKDLVAQAQGGPVKRVRLVAFASTNTNRIESGVLATLRFRVEKASAAHLELLPNMPIFAPGGANDGLRIAEPLTLAGD